MKPQYNNITAHISYGKKRSPKLTLCESQIFNAFMTRWVKGIEPKSVHNMTGIVGKKFSVHLHNLNKKLKKINLEIAYDKPTERYQFFK